MVQFYECTATCQWLTAAEGENADAQLTAWVAENGALIRDGFDNHHTLTAIDPPGVEGCVIQLEVEYHLQFQTPAEQAAAEPVLADIINLGSECDSTYTMQLVHERPE